ncbi:MAG: mandelate racemase/muconate lactonizing enzyme family protein [Maribacter sp.]
MKNRREFLKTSISTGLFALLPGAIQATLGSRESTTTEYMLEQQITQNIKGILTSPILIEKIELIKALNAHFVKVTDRDGILGVTKVNWSRLSNTMTLFQNLVAKNFIGQDARDIAFLPDRILKMGRNYKFVGLPYWNSIGTIEIALWDLIGKKADKPAHFFLGEKVRDSYPVYISSLEREKPIEKELERIQRTVESTGATAAKIKIGGRMKNTTPYIERTNRFVPLTRKVFGNDFDIYVDGNSSYTAEEAIEVLKLLEDNDVKFFEEPCYWQDLWSHKKVREQATTCAIAGGEQDSSLDQFRLMCEIKAMDILQPDTYYNGGIVRTLKVAHMAKEYGVGFTPHSPKVGPMAAAPSQIFAVCPELTGHQEYRVGGESGQKPWHTPFLPKNGQIQISKEPGLGVVYDAVLWKNEKVLWSLSNG